VSLFSRYVTSNHPGEIVATPGLYKAVHPVAHTAVLAFVLQRGAVFPPCERCGEKVRYLLVDAEPAEGGTLSVGHATT